MDLYWIGLIINIIFIIALVGVIFVFLLPPFLGAPFVPTPKNTLNIMIKLADVKPGERAVDLGSGDGRIVIALAKAGARAHGFEINPLLVVVSKWRIWRAGLSGKAFIHWANLFSIDFSEYEIVTVYGLMGVMKKLENKIKNNLPVGGRIVSHAFKFPNWHFVTNEEAVFLYKK